MLARLLPTPDHLWVRPIRATDEDGLLDLFERLSPMSRMRRFLAPTPRLSARELAYLTEVDHRRHEALVVIAPGGAFAGVGRYACAPDEPGVADFAFAVADAWQARGIGSALAPMVLDRARANGIRLAQGSTLADNLAARRLLGRMGFAVRGVEGGVVDLELDLTVPLAVGEARAA
jgi:protein lysine acetyltransferase